MDECNLIRMATEERTLLKKYYYYYVKLVRN